MIVSTNVDALSLRFLTHDEIHALSSSELKNVGRLGLETTQAGCIHDAALGCTDLLKLCSTCNETANCDGHLGHLDFALIILHPLLIPELIKILKTVCLHCLEIKHSYQDLDIYAGIFQLIEFGYPAEARALLDYVLERKNLLVIKTREHLQSPNLDHLETCLPGEIFKAIKARFEYINKHLDQCNGAQIDLGLWNESRARFCNGAASKTSCPHCQRRCKFALEPTHDLACIELSWRGSQRPACLDVSDTYPEPVDFNALDQQELVERLRLFVEPPEVSRLDKNGRVSRVMQLHALHLVPILKRVFGRHWHILSFLFPATREMGYDFFLMHSMGVAGNCFRPPLVTPEKQIVLHARSDALLDIAMENALLKMLLSVFRENGPKQDKELICDFLSRANDQRQAMNFKSFIRANANKFSRAIFTCLSNLQRKVAAIMDNDKASTHGLVAKPGIKQTMERKEGTVRHNMLGKRVNYAARTVIAPDCFIGTNQIGIPLYFATELTIPEHVTSYNVTFLSRLVMNGAKTYPGANFIRDANGKLYKLSALRFSERKAKAKLLLSGQDDLGTRTPIVYRHVLDGDVVLMNRQPTLHKPGIMGHLVKVLLNQKTFRLNYVNCNTYNADFDGDEMNLHLPQDYKARAEARLLANADCQFTVPKDGQPIRGLIQDHCQGGAFLTCKDTFLTRAEYCNLCYIALCNFLGPDLVLLNSSKQGFSKTRSHYNFIKLDNRLYQITRQKTHHDFLGSSRKLVPQAPAIVYPRHLWTGKQVITTVLKNMIDVIAHSQHQGDLKFASRYKGINLLSKSKTPGDAWGGALDGDTQEAQIVILNSELLQGVLDKSQFGATPYGLVHLVNEFLGPRASGMLLGSFAHLFTAFLQMRGATCSPRDLLLTSAAEAARARILRRIRHCGLYIQQMFLALAGPQSRAPKQAGAFQQQVASPRQTHPPHPEVSNSELLKRGPSVLSALTRLLGGASRGRVLGRLASVATGRVEQMELHHPSWLCLEDASEKLHVDSAMKLKSGLAISKSTYKLITTQYKQNPNAFYRNLDRFFQSNIASASGAANELVDGTFVKFPLNGFAGMVTTGAKGSKVNFLMICSLLNQQTLEGKRVPVMPSVRTLPSFAFGDFGARAGGLITDRFLTGLRPQEYFFHCMSGREGLVDTCVKTAKSGYLQRCVLKAMEDVVCCYDSTVRTSEGRIVQFYYGEDGINVERSAYLDHHHEHVIMNKYLISHLPNALNFTASEKFTTCVEAFAKTQEDKQALYMHLMKCACQAGEAVGCIAGQSIGEPATQMTLNTFHLAGHGSANVTLGIPRLVELLQNTKTGATPYFSAPILGQGELEIATNAQRAINALLQVPLSDAVAACGLDYAVHADASGLRHVYTATVQFEDLTKFAPAIQSTPTSIIKATAKCLLNRFLKRVNGLVIVTMDMHAPHNTASYLRHAWEAAAPAPRPRAADRIAKALVCAGARQADPPTADPTDPATANPTDPTTEDPDADLDPEDGSGSGDDEVDYSDSEHQKDPEDRDSQSPPPGRKRQGSKELNLSRAVFQFAQRLRYCRETGRLILTFGWPHAKCPLYINALPLLKQAINSVVLKSCKGIKRTRVSCDQDGTYRLVCDGTNISRLFGLSMGLVDPNRIKINDVFTVYSNYGIEAARSCIVTELNAVFSFYGIAVNIRHLTLIADFMTQNGDIRPFTRYGMARHASPLLQMSFESTIKFLIEASLRNGVDTLKAPAASIMVGKPLEVGAGACDILLRVAQPKGPIS
ncbi:bifunctional RNA polymerase [Babesia duncani]|uniref:DNA-directed RNA polymerase n=1 Tax=Babesia duncani TaxID=323732 RepID=A0AAD9PL72_9APIC|nr:bifunctional RNA polymerase [Babesia duncani]